MGGLAVMFGIGGLQGVIGLPITSLGGGCGGMMGFAVSYLRGGCVGVVRLVVFSLRGGRVGGMGLAVLYLRGARVGVVGLVTSYHAWRSRRGRRACSIVGARRRSRRWWGRACGCCTYVAVALV